jgi:hypothetical protein
LAISPAKSVEESLFPGLRCCGKTVAVIYEAKDAVSTAIATKIMKVFAKHKRQCASGPTSVLAFIAPSRSPTEEVAHFALRRSLQLAPKLSPVLTGRLLYPLCC